LHTADTLVNDAPIPLPGEVQPVWETPVAHVDPRQQTPGVEHGLGEQTVPPPCQANPTFTHALWVCPDRQNPLVAQHAPTGKGQKVVLHALLVPPYTPPTEVQDAGVRTVHAPVLATQHAPVGHALPTHAEPLPWYTPPTPPQSESEADRHPLPMQHAPGHDWAVHVVPIPWNTLGETHAALDVLAHVPPEAQHAPAG
jgi:hypothetical protein